MITVTGPKQLTLPSALGGDDSVYTFVLAAVSRGLVVEDIDAATCRIRGLTDLALFTLPLVKTVVDKGAEVSGYPVFFKFLDPLLPCPFAELKKDLDGKSLPLENWHEWGVVGESHKPVKLGRDWYRSNNVGASGEPLPASKWITPPTGVTLVTVEQFRAIPRPNPTP